MTESERVVEWLNTALTSEERARLYKTLAAALRRRAHILMDETRGLGTVDEARLQESMRSDILTAVELIRRPVPATDDIEALMGLSLEETLGLVPLASTQLRIKKAQKAGGSKGFQRNETAQEQARENPTRIAKAAAKPGATKKGVAKELGIDVKTVRKHWPKEK